MTMPNAIPIGFMCAEPPGADRTAVDEPSGFGRPASRRARADRRRCLRRDGARRLLPEPARDGDALLRARPRRRRRDRRGAARSGNAVRRQRRKHGRAGSRRASGDRAHDPRRKGSAAERRGRQRTFRQARVARSHLVHAGRHAPEGARGRARAHDPDDALRQGGARAYRARRRRVVPPRAAAAPRRRS